MTRVGPPVSSGVASSLALSVCKVLSAGWNAAVPLTPTPCRGAVDASALRARFSNAVLHANLSPADSLQRRLHDACEQARVEAVGALRWPGVAQNLSALNAAELLGTGLPACALALLHALRVAVAAPIARDAAHLPVLDPALQRLCEPLLATLGCQLEDQQTYAASCHRLWELLDLHAYPTEAKTLPQAPSQSAPVLPTASLLRELRQQRKGAADVLRRIAGEPRGTLVAPLPVVEVDEAPYRVYTRRHDLVQRADAICTPAQRVPLQQRLAQLTARHRRAHGAAALHLQRCLLARQRCRWQFDSDNGLLDPAWLAQLVIDPLRPPRLRSRVEAPAIDTHVTLLIDNSGSLRGQPIETAAASVALLMVLLERCGVSTEILGYTTTGWHGGPAAASWRADGSPVEPGRIAALRHLIYKTVGESSARSRSRLAALLHADLLRDNVDGEALQWALQRLARSRAGRRVLLVLCDGEPQEPATLSANHPLYLQRHVQQVVAAAASGGVDVIAIGLHREVSACYAKAVVVDDVSQLARVLPLRLAQLLSPLRRPTAVHRRARP